MKNFFKSFFNNERLFKNYVSSAIGVCIIGAYFVLRCYREVSYEESVLFFALAGTFLRMKDSFFNVLKK